MEDIDRPYRQNYDWDGDGDVDADDARVYLSRCLLIRLTDTNKKPLPFAKCRIVEDRETVYCCNDRGVVQVPIKRWNQEFVDIEWEMADAHLVEGAEGYPWRNTFYVNIKSQDEEDCKKRLTHLGFYGDTLAEQVMWYQSHFNRTQTGNLAEIRDELVKWHDGGDYPEQEMLQDSAASADSSDGEPEVERISHISLLLYSNSGICPVVNRNYSLQMLDGSIVTGKTDDEGRITVEECAPGDYLLSIDAFDEDVYIPSTPLEVMDQIIRVPGLFM